jgi:hypothetical protein
MLSIYNSLPVQSPDVHYSDVPVKLNVDIETYIGHYRDKIDGKLILTFNGTLVNSVKISESYLFKAGDTVRVHLKHQNDGTIEYVVSAPPHDTNWVSFRSEDDSEIYDGLIKKFNINTNELQQKMSELTLTSS